MTLAEVNSANLYRRLRDFVEWAEVAHKEAKAKGEKPPINYAIIFDGREALSAYERLNPRVR